MKRLRRISLFVAVVFVALEPAALHAVIKRKYPLKAVIAEAQYILEAKVVSIDAGKKRLVVEATRDLKGKLPFRRLNVNLASGQKDEPEKMLRRLEKDLPLVLFATASTRRGARQLKTQKAISLLAFTDGTWFSLRTRVPASDEGAKPAVCAFRCCEVYLRRTFAGTTKDLARMLPGIIAGKQPAPPYDEKEKPGLGPEIGSAKNDASP